MRLTISFLLVASILLLSGIQAQKYDGIVVENAERTIDLTTQLARYTTKFTVANQGKQSAKHFFVLVEETQAKKLAHISASSENSANLGLTRGDVVKSNGLNFVEYQVNLGQELAADAKVVVVLKQIFTRVMTPFPNKINQGEKQSVTFDDAAGHTVPSPYTVKSVTTTVKLPSSVVHSYSQNDKYSATVKGSQVTLGPYTQQQPLTASGPLRLHFENTAAFLVLARVERDIEVSHWGNIAVEERTVAEHRGAALKNSFSRFEYQMNPLSGVGSVKSIDLYLPRETVLKDAYYRDEIGNISTSFLQEKSSERGYSLELQPRFPLFGGWKTEYTYGYSLPTAPFLSRAVKDSSLHVLNMSVIEDYKTDVVIEHLVIRVTLPEGASQISLHLPFSFDKQGRDIVKTYLDTTGRPVVVLEKFNVVNEHRQAFQISYHFPSGTLWREPLLLIAGYMALFLVFIAYNRFELPIKPVSQAELEEKAQRIKTLLTEYLKINKERQAELLALDKTFTSFIGNERNDWTKWDSTAQRAEVGLTAHDNSVNNLLAQLDELSEGLAAHIRAVEHKERERRRRQKETCSKKIKQRKDKIALSDLSSFDKTYQQLTAEIESDVKVLKASL
jgi:oligosaccharyltransferase complex subunit alpha (ribophorin I)